MNEKQSYMLKIEVILKLNIFNRIDLIQNNLSYNREIFFMIGKRKDRIFCGM